jgi:RinA family phage transcriptional activator
MGLKREIRVYIESELRDYDNTKKEWEQIQSEITNGKNNIDDDYMEKLGLEVPDRCNSTTESKALKLISNKRLSQLERTIRAFERVLTNLQEDKYRLVVLKYWTYPQTLTDEGIAQELVCDKRTLYKWVDGIMVALAKELGVIN